jgi:secretion/DNA translocation related CpaE-like protein
MVRTQSEVRALEPAGTVPLLCTADDALLDVLLDWCSAVGVVPDLARDSGMVRRSWRGAQFVLVGDDLAAEVAADLPPRRPSVFVVSRPGRSPGVPPAATTDVRSGGPWHHAVALGAEDVLDTADRERALATLTAAVDGGGEACVVAVVGGVGGAGASCYAASVAIEAGRRGHRVLLVDGDPLGGGLDVLLGIENAEGQRWPAAGPQTRAVTARSLTDALPQAGNVWVLTAGRAAEGDMESAVGLLASARRGFDVVVCDVDRHLDSLGSELLAHALLTVVVVPEEVRSLAAAASVVRRVSAHAASLVVVTARRRPGLSRETVEAALGLPVVARMRPDRRLQEAIDHGIGPGRSVALRRAARPLLDLLGAA